jgi:hypothetical protein
MRRIIQDQRSASRAGRDERHAAGAQKLSLRRETLRELTTPELSFAAGRVPSSTFHQPDI